MSTDETPPVPGAEAHDGEASPGMHLVPRDLLEILRCPDPACRGELHEDLARRQLHCPRCDRRYQVSEHGTPNLLLEDAIGGPTGAGA